MTDYKRVFTILFIACFLALMCVFALNWSNAHSNEQHTVNLPVIFNNLGLPTPAPTMVDPTFEPTYPPPQTPMPDFDKYTGIPFPDPLEQNP